MRRAFSIAACLLLGSSSAQAGVWQRAANAEHAKNATTSSQAEALIEKAHTMAAGAGAAALAGAVRHPHLVKGKKVSITVSGGNITIPQLIDAVKVYQNTA